MWKVGVDVERMRVQDKKTVGCLRGSVPIADFASCRDLMVSRVVLREARALLIQRMATVV